METEDLTTTKEVTSSLPRSIFTNINHYVINSVPYVKEQLINRSDTYIIKVCINSSVIFICEPTS